LLDYFIFYRARSVHDWWWIFARLWQLAAIYLEIWCNKRDVEFWNKVLYIYLENIGTLTCFKTKAWPLDLIVSHFHYGCYTVIVLEKTLFSYISRYWKNWGTKTWLVTSAKMQYQIHLHVVGIYCSEISGKVANLKTEKDKILDCCLGNIHRWEVDWHLHMIFVSDGRWDLTSRLLKSPDLTLTWCDVPENCLITRTVSCTWQQVSWAMNGESKPAHLVFRNIKFGALWLFLWRYAKMYRVGVHLMKSAVETVTCGMPRHVCPKIIHYLVVI